MPKSYKEKLKDPRWQKKRLEIFERDNYTCQKCGSDENTLHIHHRNYINGKEPWEYPDAHLVTLCADCHETEKIEADDFRELAEGFNKLDLNHESRVVASMLTYLLSSQDEMDGLRKRYFGYLESKRCNGSF